MFSINTIVLKSTVLKCPFHDRYASKKFLESEVSMRKKLMANVKRTFTLKKFYLPRMDSTELYTEETFLTVVSPSSLKRMFPLMVQTGRVLGSSGGPAPGCSCPL